MKKIILFLLPFWIFAGCMPDPQAFLQVNLMDAPADYDAVNVEFKSVQVSYSATGDNWTDISSWAGTANILMLTGGYEAILAQGEMPEGTIKRVKINLGTAHSLVIGSTTNTLLTNATELSSLIINVNTDVVKGQTAKILLDFDAAQSITANTDATYSLHPKLRNIDSSTSGALIGRVSNGAWAHVLATDGYNEYSTYCNDSGVFGIYGLPPGFYSITITPKSASNLAVSLFSDREVKAGQWLSIGTVTLDPAQ